MLRALSVVCLPTAVACTELDPDLDDCNSLGMEPCSRGGSAGDTGNAGSSSNGGSSGAPATNASWDCVGAPLPQYDLPELPGVAYIVPIVDFANPGMPPPGLKIDVCLITDLNCGQPITSVLPPITTVDEGGLVHQIRLPTSPVPFQGFLRLTATDYMQTEYYFGGPMIGDPLNPEMPQVIIGEPISMPRLAFIDTFFARLSPNPRDTNSGILALRVLNCDRQRSADVVLDLTNASAAPFTLINNLPANDSDNPELPLPTDRGGVAGFANIRAMNGGFTAIVEGELPDGRRFGNNAWTIRPNQLTLAELRTDYGYGR